jgi:hypothetical protein
MRYNISCNNLCFFTYTTFCTSYLFLDNPFINNNTFVLYLNYIELLHMHIL